MATHTLGPTPATVHWGYLDAKIPPRLTVESGDTITVDTVSGGLADVGDTSIMLPHHREICEKLKPSPGPHILTGPVAVRGAQPGDTLEIRVKAMQLTVDWGWNLIRPLRGTLPEDYPEFRCRIIPIDRKAMTCRLPWGTTIPLSPFFGILAVAPPPNYGLCTSVEPREFGGNLDNKEFVVGTSLFLPVFVPGANFSCGDGHAVQGDGEVCLTALDHPDLKGAVMKRALTRLARRRNLTRTALVWQAPLPRTGGCSGPRRLRGCSPCTPSPPLRRPQKAPRSTSSRASTGRCRRGPALSI
jgi:acetamidase/formamidase